ncbi:hypothetical protein ES705_05338 [subsurface metagenome]
MKHKLQMTSTKYQINLNFQNFEYSNSLEIWKFVFGTYLLFEN